MTKIRTIKLGTECFDRATQLRGTVTHLEIDMDQRVTYLFQPPGTNPEDGQPVRKIMLETARLMVADSEYEEIEVPFEILGSQVKDKASGFAGMAVSFIMHPGGCFHVVIQPAGVLPKTGSPIRRTDFDLRECEGDMIQKMSDEQKIESKKDKPSPTEDHFERTILTDDPILHR